MKKSIKYRYLMRKIRNGEFYIINWSDFAELKNIRYLGDIIFTF